MTYDNYIKFILTTIAIGIIGINFYLFKIDIVNYAHANIETQPRTITSDEKHIYVVYPDGSGACKFQKDKVKNGSWRMTSC